MTRIRFFSLLSLVAFAANAQSPGGMSEADMGRMMQGAQAMAGCMGNLDPSEVERLGKEGEQVQAEFKTLCAGGQRDEAQARAMEYGMKVANDPTMKAMAECGKQAQGMMPQASTPTPEELQSRHVCYMQ